jgi:stage V sporulation protein D (sporulation-specific penicillin-binding protein)
MYISSFVGFAPAESPTIVGVVVIDEPRGRHYYGGEIAAPVFREVLKDLQRLPRGPLTPGLSQVAVRPPEPAPVVVPDVRMLPAGTAERRLATLGLHARLEGHGPRVLAQEPPAGQALGRGERVTIWLESPKDSALACLPDLAGLPVREALRQLSLRRVAVRIAGSGVVIRQTPSPGTLLPVNEVRLWCEPHRARSSSDGPSEAVAASAPGAP